MDFLSGVSSISDSMNLSSSTSKLEATESKFRELLEKETSKKEDEEIKEACYEFETYFLNSMFKSMRKTINYEDGYIKRGQGETIFQDFLDEEYSKNLAKRGGIGLADMLYKNLSKN